jgi:hypothetical protein
MRALGWRASGVYETRDCSPLAGGVTKGSVRLESLRLGTAAPFVTLPRAGSILYTISHFASYNEWSSLHAVLLKTLWTSRRSISARPVPLIAFAARRKFR